MVIAILVILLQEIVAVEIKPQRTTGWFMRRIHHNRSAHPKTTVSCNDSAHWRSLLTRLRHDEDGAVMAEYGLLITLIAAVVAGSWLSTLPSPPMSRGFLRLPGETSRRIM
jgi:hypothetical protein